MAPKIKIVSKLFERLKNIKNQNVGELYGIQYEDTVYLIGFHLRSNNEKNIVETTETQSNQFDFNEYNYPFELDLYGIVFFEDEDIDEKELKLKLKNHIQDVFVTDNPIYMKIIPGKLFKTFVLLNESYVDTPFVEITLEEFHETFAYVRLIGSIPLVCDANQEAVEQNLDNIGKKVYKGDKILYKIHTNKIKSKEHYIFAEANPSNTVLTINDLIIAQSGQKPPSNNIITPLTIEFLLRTSKDKFDTEPLNIPAPFMTNSKGLVKAFDTRLNIDALAVIARFKKGSDIYTHLAACLYRRVKHLKKCLLKDMRSIPVAFHFFAPNINHFITLLYPSKSGDSDLTTYREFIHNRMCLSFDKPIFRRSNSYIFNTTLISPISKDTILKNVHLGLPPSGINGGTLSIVQGNYEYYHYKQQGENDDGWGCAYRSLQTLFSWFLEEGYTSREVPTLREIQQTLVDIQDKPPKFVGSRDWIGSTEVSFVLDTLLGVTCRILNVSANETILSRAPELSLHFEKHGTPVMIGGGVLAHTILGIDYDKENDTAKFLVLDPHYTGEENIQVIQNKGWCGWKNEKFWKKGTFYNMCLPMRKVCV